METQSNAKLFAKIAKVMAKVRTLEKTGENKFDRYKYVTADAIATSMGAVLADAGIVFLPSLVSVETSEYTTQKGGSNFRTVANFQMTLACTETGATWTSLWSGEAIDRSDKSISKAAVSAVKYFLLKTFLLAGGDDEDADASTPTVERAKPAGNYFVNAPDTENPDNIERIVDGDVLFMPDTGPERATVEQLDILDAWGKKHYGDQWAAKLPKLVKGVTTGATDSASQLSPSECDRLIEGIQERQLAAVQSANGATK